MNILEKKETKIIAVAVMVILIIIAGIMLFNQNNLKQTKDSLEHEAGKELAFDAQDYFHVDEETAAEITFDASRVDVNTVGEYKATAGYKSKTYMIKVNVIDTTAPMVDFACRYVLPTMWQMQISPAWLKVSMMHPNTTQSSFDLNVVEILV